MNASRFIQKLKEIGPGAIITASFIGPGTVTTATRAGAGFGFALLWAVIFAIVATIILQEMVARIGVVTKQGLGENIRELFDNKILKFASVYIIMIAVAIGCAAYISGDLLGTSLGVSYLFDVPENIVAPILGVIILILALTGGYKIVEKLMIFFVILMGIIFVTTMFIAGPDILELLQGAFVPGIPSGSILMVIALIGTTVVPYNFFIHAQTASEKWGDTDKLSDMRFDTILMISAGGLITAAILITAGALIQGTEVTSVVELAAPLEPLMGGLAPIFISVGLFAAGFSSAIASPMGAAATVSSFMHWKGGFQNRKYKLIFAIVIIIGIITSAIGFEPLEVLLIAQALNGIILPLIAIFIMIVINKKGLMGEFKNAGGLNVLGWIITAGVTFLGAYSLIDAVKAFI
ncbi:Nramp family divalent metal transporter [Lacicoccus qingdaonensis]|uniref:NRAMP (Natural resistance-associated macrophage protein) metal ion transporters n=1 Tax=Lacicoccus qingdaonensis TaxID=576118 RepID=A0A1G9GWD8_9BACL|nr:Nramp family divalent metal transporter [Salinicoccus qingdaonensis]SDL05001.1 NRAMP (natural resistance-associated macrophage protein) metal ion transporters [Salinicoccus qingdaonensis]